MHAISLKTGTRLVRSWSDKSYHVLVGDDGFEFEDRHYASLGHIARAKSQERIGLAIASSG